MTTRYEDNGDPPESPGHVANKALNSAELKGARARHAGRPVSDCPYPDHRTPGGHTTWSRGYLLAWQRGWRIEDRYLSELPTPTTTKLHARPAKPNT